MTTSELAYVEATDDSGNSYTLVGSETPGPNLYAVGAVIGNALSAGANITVDSVGAQTVPPLVDQGSLCLGASDNFLCRIMGYAEVFSSDPFTASLKLSLDADWNVMLVTYTLVPEPREAVLGAAAIAALALVAQRRCDRPH